MLPVAKVPSSALVSSTNSVYEASISSMHSRRADLTSDALSPRYGDTDTMTTDGDVLQPYQSPSARTTQHSTWAISPGAFPVEPPTTPYDLITGEGAVILYWASALPPCPNTPS